LSGIDNDIFFGVPPSLPELTFPHENEL